jgi:hypothetical protein
MADSSSIGIIFQMVLTVLGSSITTIRSLLGLFKQLLSAMGGLFGAGGWSPYIGAAIIFIVAVALVKFFLTSSKLIITLIGAGILLMLVLTLV